MRRGALLGIALLAPAATATPDVPPPITAPRPKDFAYAIPILTDGNEAFYGLRLPAAVYRGLTRTDRGDLRVFDARDRVVQHALNLHAPLPKPAPAAAVPLPLFPLPAADAPATGAALHVHVDAHGAVVDVTDAPAAGEPATRYLLDASALTTRIETLRFVWTSTPKPLVVALKPECSADLDHWSGLAGATLADLQAGVHRLRQDGYAMPAMKCRYLRFDWPGAEAKLERVEALPVPPQAAPPAEPLQRLELQGRPGAEGAWEYDTGGFFPVVMFDLAFASPNTVMEAVVQVRGTPQSEWRDVHRGLVYDYEAGGRKLRSAPVALPEVTGRHWRVRPAVPEGAPAAAPVLKLGWRGDPLVFVNSGAPPYRLAFGGLGVRPSGATFASLFGAQPPPVAPARLGEQQELAGQRALRPPVPWQRYALWAVLVLGVAGLGRLASKLWKEMGRPA
ncbi:MAG: DUF3999 domain-containing protein [Gammaproteobacteria bacterium]|nr:DUF3999 domain-containing protein [Gammaproteobacteria bacterium]